MPAPLRAEAAIRADAPRSSRDGSALEWHPHRGLTLETGNRIPHPPQPVSGSAQTASLVQRAGEICSQMKAGYPPVVVEMEQEAAYIVSRGCRRQEASHRGGSGRTHRVDTQGQQAREAQVAREAKAQALVGSEGDAVAAPDKCNGDPQIHLLPGSAHQLTHQALTAEVRCGRFVEDAATTRRQQDTTSHRPDAMRTASDPQVTGRLAVFQVEPGGHAGFEPAGEERRRALPRTVDEVCDRKQGVKVIELRDPHLIHGGRRSASTQGLGGHHTHRKARQEPRIQDCHPVRLIRINLDRRSGRNFDTTVQMQASQPCVPNTSISTSSAAIPASQGRCRSDLVNVNQAKVANCAQAIPSRLPPQCFISAL
jgi:hypothetical protein